MVTKIGSTFWLLTCLAVALVLLPGRPARAEHVTREQLRSLMPDEADLPGFLRLQLSQFKPSQDPTGADSDFVRLNHDVTEWMPGRPSTPAGAGTVSVISRNFVSRNGYFTLRIEITLCDTPEAAREEVTNFRRGAQSGYWPGTLSGGPRIGEESWYASRNALLCRQGRIMVFVNGDTTPHADKQENVSGFPIPALEALAYEVLLRASQQSALTGVPARSATPAVNGHALPKDALMVAGRVYVPVQEFAKAMRLAMGRR